MKSGPYMTTGNDQFSGWTDKKLQSTCQSQTCTWKGHGHCLVICCLSDPLQLSEFQWKIICKKYAQQIEEMHWKLQCLQTALANRIGQLLLHDNTWPQVAQPTLQKLNKLSYRVLLYLPYSSDLFPTDNHFFEHLDKFYTENASTTSKRQQMLSKSPLNPEAPIFTLQE